MWVLLYVTCFPCLVYPPDSFPLNSNYILIIGSNFSSSLQYVSLYSLILNVFLITRLRLLELLFALAVLRYVLMMPPGYKLLRELFVIFYAVVYKGIEVVELNSISYLIECFPLAIILVLSKSIVWKKFLQILCQFVWLHFL